MFEYIFNFQVSYIYFYWLREFNIKYITIGAPNVCIIILRYIPKVILNIVYQTVCALFIHVTF